MAFCKACGADVGGAAFCPKCGANQGAVQAAPAAAGSSESPTAGMEENVAGLLCYLPFVGWIIWIIFLLIDKRSFREVSCGPGIAFNICIRSVCWICVFDCRISYFSRWHNGDPYAAFPDRLLMRFSRRSSAFYVFWRWVFLMYKAYQHEKFKLPIIGNIVEKMVGQEFGASFSREPLRETGRLFFLGFLS